MLENINEKEDPDWFFIEDIVGYVKCRSCNPRIWKGTEYMLNEHFT